MEEADKPRNADIINEMVRAELPDCNTDPELHARVLRHMIHGPCGHANWHSPCMKEENGALACQKQFPKSLQPETIANVNGFPGYRRRDIPDDEKPFVGRHQIDNRWVVPYNPYLLMRFDCHINIEVCTTFKSVKYIYKYIFKGHDSAAIEIIAQTGQMEYNEVRQHLDTRYISAPEAAWRLNEFPMHFKSHSIIRLPVHDENMQSVYFKPGGEKVAAEKSRETKLTAFFKLNQQCPEARQYTYNEIAEHYVYIDKDRRWKKRQRYTAEPVIGRMYSVSPLDTARYYLRLLLLHKQGPTSFKDMRTVNGVTYETYHQAALEAGLLEDDREPHRCLTEAVSTVLFSIRIILSIYVICR